MAGRELRFAAYAPRPDARPDARPDPVSAVLAEATEEDVPVLGELQARARGGAAGDWADSIRRALGRRQSLVVTAKIAGEAVGYANAEFLPEHPVDRAPAGYYLTGVTVDPDWRRRGIATLLTRRRMDWIRERDAAVWCFVSARNGASLDLHRDLGFRRERPGASFQGVEFAGGEGWLLRADPPRA
ncbi:Ribosomal protein S18 acetylase RimI [Actinacidiphila rubida]|uniref:Ribosomal protein S18 acetylase RimI n=3 Tax=Actinacidiphila rubida TaxID=310780 RepID=A0A1H8JFS3_9ACTN|nr:Ribosomal protein S18 acetylase RimI [Actinacidiphila rubida]